MSNKFLIVLCIVALALISPVVSADVCNATYNLSTTQLGSTYISWSWDSGINLTDIFIDGVAQCGYDTEINQIKFSGLYPLTTYTIRIARYGGGESTCSVSTSGESGGGFVGTVIPGYSGNFSNGDNVRVNQSSVQDPARSSTPWWLWILSGYIGLGLLVVALLKPRTYRMDYEINIILSVVAWPFIWYWTWGGLTSVDYIVGTAITATQGETVMITQHILYTQWVLGWIGVGGCILAVFLTVLLASQYELFNENEGKVKAKAEQKEKEEL
jgi:hypothetical protein